MKISDATKELLNAARVDLGTGHPSPRLRELAADADTLELAIVAALAIRALESGGTADQARSSPSSAVAPDDSPSPGSRPRARRRPRRHVTAPDSPPSSEQPPPRDDPRGGRSRSSDES